MLLTLIGQKIVSIQQRWKARWAFFDGIVRLPHQYKTSRKEATSREVKESRFKAANQLSVRYSATGLSSFSGLELIRQYLSQVGLAEVIRWHAQRAFPSCDFGRASKVLLVQALLITGSRRVRHVIGIFANGFWQVRRLYKPCVLNDQSKDARIKHRHIDLSAALRHSSIPEEFQ